MLPTDLVAPVGAGGLLSIAIVLILTGKLYPKSVLKDWVPISTHRALERERDLWRTLALENRADLRTVLIPVAEAAHKTFHAVDEISRAGDSQNGERT